MRTPYEGGRDTGKGIIIATSPDVCRTPAGSSTVDIPYQSFAFQNEDANTCATVRRPPETLAAIKSGDRLVNGVITRRGAQ